VLASSFTSTVESNLVANLTLTENLTIRQEGSLRLGGSNTLTIPESVDLGFSGSGPTHSIYLMNPITGAGNIVNSLEGGPYLLFTSTGNSGFTGNIEMASGSIQAESASSFGGATLVATNTSSYYAGIRNDYAPVIANAIKFDANAIFYVGGAINYTLSGAVDLGGVGSTGTLYVSGPTTTFSGVISNGSLSVDRGTAILSGTNTYDKTYIKGGASSEVTIKITGDSNLGTGAIYLSSANLANSTTSVLEITGSGVTIDNDIVMNAYDGGGTIKNDNNVTLSGQISEVVDAWPYKLYKTGVGTLTLSGTSNYNTGALNVEAGVVNITGALNNAATATIASGTAFGGSGAFGGATTVNNGGKLGIDGAVSVFTIDDNLVLSSGATYSVEINGTTAGTQHDQTVVNGAVNLTGATLSVSGSHTPVTGNSIVLIANDGSDAVSGTFIGLAEGATVTLNDVGMKISYVGGTGNDVVLSLNTVLVIRSLAYSATTFNEAAANNGSITTASTITLTNDRFTGAVGDALGVVSHVPDGLTAVLVKSSDTTATLSFTGNATAHANAHDIANLTVSFADADFAQGSAATVTNAYKPDLTVNFADRKNIPEPDPTPTPDPVTTPFVTIINPDGTTTVVSTNPGANATIAAPGSGSTIVASSSGDTIVTNPGNSVILKNTGSGTVTTSGISNDTTLTLTGTGTQKVDLSGMKPGQILTIDNVGTGLVALSSLPDGVIVKLLGTGPVTLIDNDGAIASVENAAPALLGAQVGDGNGDGTPDALQSNVASALFLKTYSAQSNPGNAPPVFVSLVADAKDGKIDITNTITATLFNVRQLDAPANLPVEIKMPMGLIAFSAALGLTTPSTTEQNGTPALGASASFSLYVDPAVEANGYWKQDANKTWVNLASPAFGGQTVTEGGKTRLDFHITDGGEFDADGKVDGTITDPGAAASMPLSLVGYSPTLADGTQFWF
jgi:autotransporter-associated beta strand protein